MASIQKTAKGYRAQVSIKGVRDSQCFRTKREAIAWAESRSEELRKTAKAKPPEIKTVADAFREYQGKVSPQKRGHRWEMIRIEAFLADDAFPSSVILGELTPERLAKWRDDRMSKVSAGTVLREIGLISSILETARKEWRWIPHNPMRDIRKPKSPDHREVLYTRSQIKSLLQALSYSPLRPVSRVSQSVAVAFLVALRTGMRAGELSGLTWDRVKDGYCVLPVTKTVPRNVPLTKKSLRLVARMKGYNSTTVFGMASSSLDANFRKYRDKIGMTGITFHDSRHYAATQLSRKLDVLALCRMFGWSNTKQALTYYNEHASSIAQRLNEK
jgi:integrase